MDFVRDGMAQSDSPGEKLKGQLIVENGEFTASVQKLIGRKDEIPEIPKLQRHVGRPCLEVLFPEGQFVVTELKVLGLPQ
jgi:putative transposase